MKHIKKIKIDIDKKNFEVIPSVQYDSNTRFLHINLLNGSVPFDLTGCSVKISGTKPDGTAIFNNCTIVSAKEGFIEMELTEQINAVPGTVKCELKLYNGKGVLTTKQFEIEVTASVTSKEITSSDEFKALTDALNEVNNIDNKFESLTSEAVKEATEKEIQKQIANGGMTHMTIADNSIDEKKYKDFSIPLKKLSDNVFESDYIYEFDIKNSNQNYQIAPMFDFSEHTLNSNINIKMIIKLIEGDSQYLHLRCTSTDEVNGEGYTTLKYSTSVNITLDEAKEINYTYQKEFDKKYFVPLISGINGTFKIQIKFILNEIETDPIKINLPDSSIDNSVIKKALSVIPRGAIATQNYVVEEINNSEFEMKEYINNYDFEIKNDSIGIENFKKDLFGIGEEFKFIGINDHVFITSDLTVLGSNRIGKVIDIEYEAFADNLSSDTTVVLYEKVGIGKTYWEYSSPIFKSMNDVKNKIYKGKIQYTINNDDTYQYILFYPQIKFGISGVTCDLSIRNLKITCDGVEIPVLGRRDSSNDIIPSTPLEYQEGKKLAKQEYVLKVIEEKTNGYDNTIQQVADDIEQLRSLIGNGSETVVESVLNGKKGSFIGDSITFGTGTSDVNTKTYHKLIASKYSMISNNCAMPGYTVAKKEGIGSFFDLYQRVTTDSNYISILGAVNDYGNDIPLGVFGDSENSTFYGAMKLHCEKLLTDYPNAKVAFMTPFQSVGCNNVNEAGYKLIDYVNAMIEVASYYGIAVLDLYRSSGLCPDFPTNKTKFYSDMVHLNDSGHEWVYLKIAKFFEQL